MFSYIVILLLMIYTAPRSSFDLQKYREKKLCKSKGLLNGWFWKLVSVFEQEKFVLELSEL